MMSLDTIKPRKDLSMCRQQKQALEASPVAEGAYQGRTIRLDQRADYRRTFPYWALWLIWPLLVLGKWIVPFSWGMFATITGIVSGPVSIAAAIVLIVLGVVLLLRS
jgi:hypothetical protein